MTPRRVWAPGDLLTHRFNPELGIGRVTALDGRVVVAEFPHSNTTLRFGADTDALMPVDLSIGRPVRITATHEETAIAARLRDGTIRLANGQTVPTHALWPIELESALLERLLLGHVDELGDFLTRLDILHLLTLREADGLGPFLGGRVRLFPHQLHVAERASVADPVRWLLADEVGLGKTVEAALILNRLVHTGRVERCLVVAPDSLTVQWLGELWRKYHQVFTLLDAPRLADVARDFGEGFNPFDVHRRAVIALETLVERPELTVQAVRAGIDLLVVDEAQRLRRPPGHPGEPAWRAVAPISALGRHVLLLSATPLERDAHGFFRLLQLLRPQDYPEGVDFEALLAQGTPLAPCTSSTRRADIGGLPPRVGVSVALDRAKGSSAREAAPSRRGARQWRPPCEARRHHTRWRAATRVDRIRRALASGAALSAVLGREDRALRQQAEAMDASDPRIEWLLSHAPRWRDAREKTLIFVAHRETLEMLRTAFSHGAQLGHRSIPRGPAVGAPRHRGRAVPRARRPKPAHFHRVRRRRPQLRVLPTPGALRPALEPGDRGTADRTAGPHRPARSLSRSSTSARPMASALTSRACTRRLVSFANRPRASIRNWPTSRQPSRTLPSIRPRHFGRRRRELLAPTQAARSLIRTPRISSCTTIHTVRRWPRVCWRVCRRELDEFNQQVVVTACARLGFAVERRVARAVSRSSSGPTRSWTAAGGVGRFDVGRHIRSRGSGGGRGPRLLRLGSSPGGGHIRAFRGQPGRPRRTVHP